MRSIKVKQGQCIKDVAIEHCGSIDACFDIVSLNNIGFTDDLIVGAVLLMPQVVDSKVVNYYTREGLMPASVKSQNLTGEQTGIGYMQIGNSFIIS